MISLTNMPPKEFLDDESRTLIVSAKTKQHWAVMLDLLLALDRVCKKHKIRYFVDGGTMLGAARHGGFIPWDDDVDVAMLREDYEKLKSVAAEEFADEYFFQTNDTDREWFQTYGRLCNERTAAIAKVNLHDGKTVRRNHQGIFIDIFPLDKMPDGQQERKIYLGELSQALGKLSRRAAALLQFRRPSRRILTDPRIFVSFVKGAMMAVVMKLTGYDLIRSSYLKVHSIGMRYIKSEAKECGECTFLPDLCERIRFPVENYESEPRTLTFEHINVPVPNDHERYLELMFRNWKEHVVGTGLHGGQLIDTDKSWREYL